LLDLDSAGHGVGDEVAADAFEGLDLACCATFTGFYR